jgi:hypothetical protein
MDPRASAGLLARELSDLRSFRDLKGGDRTFARDLVAPIDPEDLEISAAPMCASDGAPFTADAGFSIERALTGNS